MAQDDFCIADKVKQDEYENIVEHTADSVRYLKLYGKSAVEYIGQIYGEEVKGVWEDISGRRFLSDTLYLFYQKKN